MLRLLFCFLLLASPALAQRLVTQTATPTAGQPVLLDLKYAHHIRVRPGSGAALTVRAQVTIADKALSDSYALLVQAEAGELRVEEKLDKDRLEAFFRHGWHDDRDHDREPALRLDYEVTLPAGQPLRVKTVTGDVDAESLTNSLAVSTVSGNLALAGLQGAVKAHTVSGDVKLRSLAGTAPVDAVSVSGNVDVDWPRAHGAELSLKSISGEVYADSTVTFSNLRTRSYVGYELHGQASGSSSAGGSGPLVSLHTVSGDVFFRRQ